MGDSAFLAEPAGALFAGPRQFWPVTRVLLPVVHGGTSLRGEQAIPYANRVS